MKNTRKLIVTAIALVLTLALATTTAFAWFAMNTQVTAGSMEIKAKTDQVYLQIINEDGTFDDEDTQVSATAKVLTKDVYAVNVVEAIDADPTTCTAFNGGNIVWVINTSSDPAVSDANGDYVVASGADGTGTNNYTLINTFKLRLNPTAGIVTAPGALKIASVTLKDSNTDDIRKGVSVLVVCGDQAQLWKQNSEGAWVATGDTTLTATAFADSSATGTSVQVYVFFDGDNENVFTNNVIDTHGYTVELTFSVAA